MSKCYICGDPRKNVLEEHHLTPQAYGGKDGLTTMICNNCHSLAHKAALSILSKKPKGQDFFPIDQIERARPIVMQIVKATQEARDDPNLDHPTTLMIKIPKRTLKLLHLLKTDANFTNLEKFVIAIINSYIRGKF